MAEWLLMLAVFLLILAVGGWFADRQDERADARRRNGR